MQKLKSFLGQSLFSKLSLLVILFSSVTAEKCHNSKELKEQNEWIISACESNYKLENNKKACTEECLKAFSTYKPSSESNIDASELVFSCRVGQKFFLDAGKKNPLTSKELCERKFQGKLQSREEHLAACRKGVAFEQVRIFEENPDQSGKALDPSDTGGVGETGN
jgi:hypothetical protein